MGTGVPEGRIKRAALVGSMIRLMAAESLNVHVDGQPVHSTQGPLPFFKQTLQDLNCPAFTYFQTVDFPQFFSEVFPELKNATGRAGLGPSILNWRRVQKGLGKIKKKIQAYLTLKPIRTLRELTGIASLCSFLWKQLRETLPTIKLMGDSKFSLCPLPYSTCFWMTDYAGSWDQT